MPSACRKERRTFSIQKEKRAWDWETHQSSEGRVVEIDGDVCMDFEGKKTTDAMVSLASNVYTQPEGRQDAPGLPLGPLTTSPSFLRSIVHVLTSPEAGLTLSWKMPFVFLMAAFRSASDILENESARFWCARSGGREQTREDQPQEGRPGKQSEH